MQLSLFDLHCDTAYEMLRQGEPLTENRLAVSLEKAKDLQHYIQVMALWTDRQLDDESGWRQFSAMLHKLRADPALQNEAALLITALADDSRPQLLLGVEDARILAGRLERVDTLYREGVRILTPLWQGETVIGGSHDTNVGLTDFGRLALDRAAGLGIVLDISHASETSAEEMLEIAAHHARPVIASHSDSHTVCPVSRNLRDRQAKAILDSGGVIGLNLYHRFLTDGSDTPLHRLPAHIDHFLELGAENALCLGCDMDGCELPPEIPHLGALHKLAEFLQRYYSDALIEKLFYRNAMRFALANLN